MPTPAAEFGMAAPPAEPYALALELFGDLARRYRRAVGDAAACGHEGSKLDALSLDFDVRTWEREFEAALFQLGQDAEARGERVARANTHVANLSMDLSNMRKNLEELSAAIEALR